jgi:hypothetical protein
MRVAQCEDLVVVRVRDGRVNGFEDRKLRGRHDDCAERTWGIVMWLEGSGVVVVVVVRIVIWVKGNCGLMRSRRGGRYGRWGR